jgi:hypothetical protein
MLKCYNKAESDFKGGSKKANAQRWNKYLETIEDLAYSLTYERDDADTQRACEAQIKACVKMLILH